MTVLGQEAVWELMLAVVEEARAATRAQQRMEAVEPELLEAVALIRVLKVSCRSGGGVVSFL